MLMQIPRILSAMVREHKWLKKDNQRLPNRCRYQRQQVWIALQWYSLRLYYPGFNQNPLGSLAEKLLQK